MTFVSYIRSEYACVWQENIVYKLRRVFVSLSYRLIILVRVVYSFQSIYEHADKWKEKCLVQRLFWFVFAFVQRKLIITIKN